MKIHTFKRTQFVPTTMQNAWDFFSSPDNLGKITPPSMDFRTTSESYAYMYAGQIITYTVKPFPFVKVRWVTEITQVENKKYFIDEQRFGPYTFWHHQHHFVETEGGVQMDDIVHFIIPMGFLGNMLLPLVLKKLNQIFEFRTQKVREFFPS